MYCNQNVTMNNKTNVCLLIAGGGVVDIRCGKMWLWLSHLDPLVFLLSNYLAFLSFDFSVPDDGNSRNVSGALNLISTFLQQIDNYLCNQCLSLLALWGRITLRRGVIVTTLCDRIWQWIRFPPPIKLTTTMDQPSQLNLISTFSLFRKKHCSSYGRRQYTEIDDNSVVHMLILLFFKSLFNILEGTTAINWSVWVKCLFLLFTLRCLASPR